MSNPKTFRRTTDIPKLNTTPKKRNWKLRVSLVMVIFLTIFGALFVYLLNEYITTHTFKFQSPVTFQKPLRIDKNYEIISPMSSRSASLIPHIAQVQAEEIENPFDPRSPKGVAWELIKDKWGVQEWGYFDELVTRESGWNPYSVNASSGACGIPQALPCSKMDVERWDYEGQLKWMINYIDNRYGTPSEAIKFHDDKNWY